MLLALSLAQHQKIRGADRNDHTVDGLMAPKLAQQLQELGPARGVRPGVRILSRVAPRGIEQDRLVRKPPVAVARPADATQRFLAEFLRERKIQAGIHQYRGLPGAWRSDDDVPRQLIEIRGAFLLRLLQ